MKKRPSLVNAQLGNVLAKLTSDDDVLYKPTGLSKLVIHPHSPYKSVFDIFIVICVVYSSVVAPIKVTYKTDFWVDFDIFLDVVFALDIVVQCFSGFFDLGGSRFPVLQVTPPPEPAPFHALPPTSAAALPPPTTHRPPLASYHPPRPSPPRTSHLAYPIYPARPVHPPIPSTLPAAHAHPPCPPTHHPIPST